MKPSFLSSLFFAAAATALPQIRLDDPCGGSCWAGRTNCPSGSYCQFINEWYSQCVPLSLSPILNPPTLTGGLGPVTRTLIATPTAGNIASLDPTPAPLTERQTLVEYTCGGTGYSGPTKCPAGMYCHYFDAWSSQCLPGSESSASSLDRTTSAPSPVDSSIAARTTLVTTITARS